MNRLSDDVFSIGLDVLMGKSNHGAQQNDDPAQVKPDQKNRQLGKGAVDGVVLGDADLEMDIGPLGQLPESSGNHATENRRAQRHGRIREIRVEEGQSDPNQKIGTQNGEEKEQIGHTGNLQHALHQRRALDRAGKTEGGNGQDRKRQQDAQIVAELPPQRSGSLDSPNSVQRELDVSDHRDGGRNQTRQSQRAEGLDVGLVDVANDLSDDLLRACAQFLQENRFQPVLHS